MSIYSLIYFQVAVSLKSWSLCGFSPCKQRSLLCNLLYSVPDGGFSLSPLRLSEVLFSFLTLRATCSKLADVPSEHHGLSLSISVFFHTLVWWKTLPFYLSFVLKHIYFFFNLLRCSKERWSTSSPLFLKCGFLWWEWNYPNFSFIRIGSCYLLQLASHITIYPAELIISWSKPLFLTCLHSSLWCACLTVYSTIAFLIDISVPFLSLQLFLK